MAPGLTEDLDGWGSVEGEWSSLGAGGSVGSLLLEFSDCPEPTCSSLGTAQCVPAALEVISPIGAQSIIVRLQTEWDAADEPTVVYFDDQVLNVPELDRTSPAIVALATLVSLSARVRGSRVRKPLA